MPAGQHKTSKQAKLKLLDGGAREPSPPAPLQSPVGTSRLEYAVLFVLSGAIWIAIGAWLWRWIFR